MACIFQTTVLCASTAREHDQYFLLSRRASRESGRRRKKIHFSAVGIDANPTRRAFAVTHLRVPKPMPAIHAAFVRPGLRPRLEWRLDKSSGRNDHSGVRSRCRRAPNAPQINIKHSLIKWLRSLRTASASRAFIPVARALLTRPLRRLASLSPARCIRMGNDFAFFSCEIAYKITAIRQ